ncbi:MAG TPA: 5-(carboxyamino)imidazole ribonucleotide synthase [Steroidobacteraceae bacterium]|jgi:5-(carboxyamino)imidazole ribonucleotide synthase|nr:5-(carboxyamino)imidazole ribonucleotide synthase [Steroidobacteraceae bacterium]
MTIGVVGAGQLGAMLALAGYPLGFDFLFLDRTERTPAGRFAPVVTGDFADQGLLRQLAERSEVISFDWENISVDALRAATRSTRTRIAPPLKALAAAQDRLTEKRTFERLAIGTTRFAAVDSLSSLERAIRRIGVPGVLKTRRLGYDGKGQFLLRSAADAGRAWAELGSVPLIYEEFVPFEYEVSIIGARGRRGEIVIYPLNRNYHADGVLRLTLAPWQAPRLLRAASASLTRVLEHFRYVGVLAIEFFVHRGRLIANEMAPRVHNSGHWTIEGTLTSQFENHVRAIAGMPLGSTAARGHAAMINLIGAMPAREWLLSEPGLHLHHYGKEPRHGRKLGHCTFVESSPGRRNMRAKALLQQLYPLLAIKP